MNFLFSFLILLRVEGWHIKCVHEEDKISILLVLLEGSNKKGGKKKKKRGEFKAFDIQEKTTPLMPTSSLFHSCS